MTSSIPEDVHAVARTRVAAILARFGIDDAHPQSIALTEDEIARDILADREAARTAQAASAPSATMGATPSIDDETLADAERWRALWSSERFKFMGSANFDHSAYPEVSISKDVDPNDWLHFCIEVWDRHDGKDDQQAVHGRNLLRTYVEHRRALLRESGRPGATTESGA